MMGSGARRPRAAITYRDNEFIGDMAAWHQANSDDNSEQLARLRRRLLQARQLELTPRQAQIISLYYDQELTVTQIAQQLGVHKSTVSRTLDRGRKRLKRFLRYAL